MAASRRAKRTGLLRMKSTDPAANATPAAGSRIGILSIAFAIGARNPTTSATHSSPVFHGGSDPGSSQSLDLAMKFAGGGQSKHAFAIMTDSIENRAGYSSPACGGGVAKGDGGGGLKPVGAAEQRFAVAEPPPSSGKPDDTSPVYGGGICCTCGGLNFPGQPCRKRGRNKRETTSTPQKRKKRRLD